MLQSLLLKSCFNLIHYSGLSTVLGPTLRGRGVIFCMHHVKPGGGRQTGFAPNSNLEATPEFLAEMISNLVQQGYELVSLDDVYSRLSAKEVKRPFAVFTLDDGYLDNLIHAQPVFERFNCPFAVFVSPRITDGTCEMWWRNLESVIARVDDLEISFGGQSLRLVTRNISEKWMAWKRLAPMVQAMPEYEQRDLMRSLCDRYNIDWQAYCRSVAMTWDQLRLMKRSPLATIGAHTLNHYAVSKLSDDDARREIFESGDRIAQELGVPTRHFAFPYGNVNHAGPRDFRLCRDYGYASAVTTRHGVTFADHRDHMHALPRIMVSGRYQKVRYINAMRSGVTGALSNRFRRVNVS